MIQICRKDKGKVYEAIRAGKIDAAEMSIPNLNDLKELYRLRRCQENAYRGIKYPLCLKALYSKKYEYVVQEIWTRAILHNLCDEIIKQNL